ncbi:CotS family spore coat protein [Lachnospiraceae bacterium JLR.KK008]
MNDRAISVLSEYDFEVIRTWKGRGSILFETPEGIRILKEYTGFTDKLILQNTLLSHVRNISGIPVEEILPNKEGMLWTKDQSQNTYFVKTYFGGRECSVRDHEECREAMRILARLHKAMRMPVEPGMFVSVSQMDKEYEKHNRELKKVRRFLRGKSQKNDFEIYLLKYYDRYMEKAFEIAEKWQLCQKSDFYEKIAAQGIWCHGDYQYHNLLFEENCIHVINFEKCVCDSQVRDLYLFLRKLLEKNNWGLSVGMGLLEAYQEENPLEKEEILQLYYRLAYPEKFWKIVNFYFNAGKAWIPGRNMEKFEKLLRQEKDKELFLRELLPG